MNAAIEQKETDRRGAERFAIERDIRWKLRGKKTREAPALSRTVNISSAGVLFRTYEDLLSGKLVEVAISWPVPLEDDGTLELIACGRLVRCTAGLAAIQFQKREFRSSHALSR
jgi:hypothetical protein